MKIDLDEGDLTILNDIKDLLRDIGYGDIYGLLGRTYSLVHYQLLNDASDVVTFENGSPKECKLDKKDKEAVIEIGNILNNLKYKNSNKDIFKRLTNLINKIENQKQPRGFFKFFKRKKS